MYSKLLDKLKQMQFVVQPSDFISGQVVKFKCVKLKKAKRTVEYEGYLLTCNDEVNVRSTQKVVLKLPLKRFIEFLKKRNYTIEKEFIISFKYDNYKLKFIDIN